VSDILTGSKRFYSKVEKLCYVVIMSARKLRHYFEAHAIRVLTDQLLHEIFRNRDNSGRISKWAMELLEYVVDFEKHSAIKSQVLANFVAEWTEPSSATEGVVLEEPWLVHCDGAWGVVGAGTAAILTSPSGIKLQYVVSWSLAAKLTSALTTSQNMRQSCWGFASYGHQLSELHPSHRLQSSCWADRK
jgi:hypothetical protein